MRRPRAAVAAFLSLWLACAAAAQTGGRARARVKGRGSVVVVTERGRAHTLDLSEHADAARVENVKVLFLSRAGGFNYLLLDACGPSKDPGDARQCGAGTECNVIWLKLDARWRVRAAQNERYESCWASVTSDEGPKVSGRRMTLALEDFREEVRREVAYDDDDPAAGLAVRRTPLPKTTP